VAGLDHEGVLIGWKHRLYELRMGTAQGVLDQLLRRGVPVSVVVVDVDNREVDLRSP
jgi:hypothetical protein